METMDIDQLADYLCRDVRDLDKLASRGLLPARKVNGVWRFAKAEVHHWLSTRLHEMTHAELTRIEDAHVVDVPEPLLAKLLRPECVAVPLLANTRPSVLRELVRLAEASCLVYDSPGLLRALQQREKMAPTALPGGVAIPHPHRPVGPAVLGDCVVAFGRTGSGIGYGGPDGERTDLFFLVACTTDQTHLRVLARLGRLFQTEGFLDRLREAQEASEAHVTILEAEARLTT
ncbi:MAG: PTS sugar transporter subunit IIA [Gemmataceae bacterium]